MLSKKGTTRDERPSPNRLHATRISNSKKINNTFFFRFRFRFRFRFSAAKDAFKTHKKTLQNRLRLRWSSAAIKIIAAEEAVAEGAGVA